MRAIMYHYVRPEPVDLPYFRYLHVSDFAKQLDALMSRYKVLTATEFVNALERQQVHENSAFLTFDDGLTEHLLHTAPALEERGLTGIFFVPTGPMTNGRTLDVHRIHHLLGRFGGPILRDALRSLVTPDVIDPAKVDKFRTVTYRHQSNDDATTEVKRLFNYYVKRDARHFLLDRLEAALDAGANWAANLYLSISQVTELRKRGHVVGSHGVSHRVLSDLSADEKICEVEDSYSLLELADKRGSERLFCYPYGGHDTYDRHVQQLLKDTGYGAAFAVEPRPIEAADLRTRFALPRYDCNMFPFGQASLGSHRANGRLLK